MYFAHGNCALYAKSISFKEIQFTSEGHFAIKVHSAFRKRGTLAVNVHFTQNVNFALKVHLLLTLHLTLKLHITNFTKAIHVSFKEK